MPDLGADGDMGAGVKDITKAAADAKIASINLGKDEILGLQARIKLEADLAREAAKALLEQESKKNQGFIANLEEGIYSVLKIAGCVILMLVLTPIIYTRLKCKKTLEILGLKKDENVERL